MKILLIFKQLTNNKILALIQYKNEIYKHNKTHINNYMSMIKKL